MAAERSNSTEFAILGMLSLMPMSGYDIRRFAAGSIGHFWNESYGQIYPTLKRLATNGLAVRRTERQTGKPDRHVYSITRQGRQALAAWLRQSPRVQSLRNEFLLKLFFGLYTPPAVSRQHLVAVRDADQESLKTYTDVRRQVQREHSEHPGLPYWLMSLDFGISMKRARLAWTEKALRVLKRLEAKTNAASV